MVRFVTKDELRGFAAKLTITEQASLRKAAGSQLLGSATFLSHSSKDKELVVGAIQVLEGHGAKVYIDEVDPEMPPYTSEETAGILKSRIRQTQRFVLLAARTARTAAGFLGNSAWRMVIRVWKRLHFFRRRRILRNVTGHHGNISACITG
ncbi:toll/interleukin-1 receptor domain-containing protein [Sphingopyxis granuli]|uniref:toll/interleukin-1 receptor domain-containing protein n=1 Tax=Sphingopyxis granuli TaxID=267128 RepID=UPI0020D0DDCD|nr:toll/interleukin-1 receptor domain-containing protein [Sphingopyxis granuli]